MRSVIRTGLGIGAATALTFGALTPAGAAVLPSHGATTPVDTEDAALSFADTPYTQITVTIDGTETPVRWYKEICYVAAPITVDTTQPNKACGYQSMNIFVPESARDDQDAAMYLAVNNSGWMASYIKASVSDGASYGSATSNIGAALKSGYVVIDVATRSRGIQGVDGSWVGKAPAPVVDAKAAVRYLRLNDDLMPGSTERIVMNGTSGGGALISAIGASGNSPDYYSYLEEVGAAGIDAGGGSTLRDDVLAVNAYCPITDLGNADILYDWLYTALGTRETVGQNPAHEASAALAAAYPAYQESLGLTTADGSALTADNVLDAVEAEVIRSAETYMAASPENIVPDLGEGIVITGNGGGTYENDWIDVDNAANTVVSLDMTRYLAFVALQSQLKPAPSFDQSAVTVPGSGGGPGTGESSLFGTSEQEYSNFTEYSWDHNEKAGDGSGIDDTGKTWAQFTVDASTVVDDQIDLINPLHYISTSADTAPYWYIRHGSRDRDTSFIVSLNLDRALAADPDVKDLDYRLAWNQPHAGNYDVPEAMAWIASVLADSEASADGDGIDIEATVPGDAPGTLVMTVADYGDKVTLEQARNAGDRLRFAGALPTITVTDSRNAAQAGHGGWAVSGQSTRFTSSAGIVGADHLGWSPRTLTDRPGLKAGAAVASALDDGPGLAKPATLGSADEQGRSGTSVLTAGLALDVPVDTAAGTYRAQVTVSLFPVD